MCHISTQDTYFQASKSSRNNAGRAYRTSFYLSFARSAGRRPARRRKHHRISGDPVPRFVARSSSAAASDSPALAATATTNTAATATWAAIIAVNVAHPGVESLLFHDFLYRHAVERILGEGVVLLSRGRGRARVCARAGVSIDAASVSAASAVDSSAASDVAPGAPGWLEDETSRRGQCGPTWRRCLTAAEA